MVVLHVADLLVLFSVELQSPCSVITTGSDAVADELVFACVADAVVLEVAFVELAGFAVWARAIEAINKHTEARYNIQKNASNKCIRD